MGLNDTAELILRPIKVSSRAGTGAAVLGLLAIGPVVVLTVLAVLRLLG